MKLVILCEVLENGSLRSPIEFSTLVIPLTSGGATMPPVVTMDNPSMLVSFSFRNLCVMLLMSDG